MTSCLLREHPSIQVRPCRTAADVPFLDAPQTFENLVHGSPPPVPLALLPPRPHHLHRPPVQGSVADVCCGIESRRQCFCLGAPAGYEHGLQVGRGLVVADVCSSCDARLGRP